MVGWQILAFLSIISEKKDLLRFNKQSFFLYDSCLGSAKHICCFSAVSVLKVCKVFHSRYYVEVLW